MNDNELDFEENLELSDLLLAIAKPIIEKRKEWERQEQVKRFEEQEQKRKTLMSLQTEYRDVLNLARQRIAAEKTICGNISLKIVSYLDELKEFAETYSIFPPEISDDGIPAKSPCLRIRVIRKIKYADILPSKGQIPDTEASLRSGIQMLSDMHVQCEMGLKWGICEVETWSSRDEFGWEYDRSTEYIVQYGFTIVIRFPNEIRLNGQVFSHLDVDTSTFKVAIVKAFYSPKRSKKRRVDKQNIPHDAQGVDKDRNQIVWWKIHSIIISWCRSLREFWHNMWEDVSVTPEDSFLKKIWYGNLKVKQEDEDEWLT